VPAKIAELLSDAKKRAHLLDKHTFISKLTIVNKQGRKISLRPNDEQLQIIEALDGERDVLIFKGRQIGSSTICCAYMFWRIYTSTEPITFATMSHKTSSSKHLLNIVKTFHTQLPAALQREISVDNGLEFRFADTNAGIIAVSTEGRGGLRSFSCNFCHISEFAFADKPDELKATAVSALNGGKLVIETTANHWGDGLQKEWSRAERGEANWNRVFFPWFLHAEYRLKPPAGTVWRNDEIAVRDRWALDDEQLQWRRVQVGKLTLEKFRREYPASVDEAYTVAGSTYFKEDDFADVEILNVENAYWTSYSEPDNSDAYAVGVDVSAGVGKDYSVIYVMSKMLNSPVAVWRSNTIEPINLAEQIIDIATQWNNAKVLVESNNVGAVVLNELRHAGYSNLWKLDGKDWVTTLKSKTEMFERLRGDIKSGKIRHIDKLTYNELRAITVSERNHIELGRTDGAHSDNAVALALANTCLDSVRLSERSFLPDWIRKQKANKIVGEWGARVSQSRRYDIDR